MYIARTHPTEWAKIHSELNIPTLLHISHHNHCLISSLFAWMSKTPKVDAATVFINLLYFRFKFLNIKNRLKDVNTASNLFESTIKQYGLPINKYPITTELEAKQTKIILKIIHMFLIVNIFLG